MKRALFAFLTSFSLFIPNLTYAQHEMTLDLTSMVTSFPTYLQQAGWFRDRYQGLEAFDDIQRERVNYSSLAALREHMHGPHGSEYISGIRVYYGLTEQNEIILYYVPVYADRATIKSTEHAFDVLEPAGGFQGVLANPDYDIYYAYNGSLYNLREDGVEWEEAPYNISRYRFNVTTKPGYAMNQTFSVYIPYQEIVQLYEDNKNSPYSTGSIYFNSAAKFVDNGFTHHLILTTIRDYEEPYQQRSNFYGMGADLVHTCPKDCSPVNYQIK